MVGLLLTRLKEIEWDDHRNLPIIDLIKPIIRVLNGQTIGPSEIIRIDDYSLWVLIQQIANADSYDFTATDLARRIVKRDLFKQVKCSEDKLNNLLVSGSLHETIADAIQPYCSGVSEYYFHFDSIKFDMLAEHEVDQSNFIDLDSKERTAMPIKEHPRLHVYRTDTKEIHRLYTIADAVDAAYRAVEQS